MKNIIIIVAIAILIGVGFWISKSGQKNAEVIAENAINSETTTTQSQSVKKTTSSQTVPQSTKVESFTNILPQTGNYECNYEEVSQTSRSSHVIYLSGGKMRGEFRTSTASGAMSNIMVYDGVNLYTWIEGQTVGTYMQPKSISDFPSIIPKNILEAKILGSGLNSASWSCHAWSKVPALLAKPVYVKF
jgi:hypothetical protein